MFKQSYLVCSAALLLAVAACDSSTGLSGNISQDEANQLAADMDAVATLGESDFGLGPSFSVNVDGAGSSASASVPITINNSFSVTKQCPKGGQVAIAGTTVGTGDRATHSLTLDVDATRTDTELRVPDEKRRTHAERKSEHRLRGSPEHRQRGAVWPPDADPRRQLHVVAPWWIGHVRRRSCLVV